MVKGDNMKRDETCKQRIGENYRGRMAEIMRATGNIRAGQKWAEANDYPADKSDWESRWWESVLEFGPAGEYTRRVKVQPGLHAVRVLLSTGGPEDGFILIVNRNRSVRGNYWNSVVEVHYWFSDWFDGAHFKVRADSKSERVLKDLFDPYLEGMTFEDED
jgi:hypothetical protein